MPGTAMLVLVVSVAPAIAGEPSTAALRAGLADPNGWEEISRKEADGVGEIVIRHKIVDGQNCLEGTAYATVPPDPLLNAAADIENQPKWSSWSVPASVKLSPGKDQFDYYQVLDNPSPVSDRYWFLHGTALHLGDERVFSWELVDPASHYPEALAQVNEKFPDAVMTKVNVGDWTFTPEGDKTRVRYRICTDAGGRIPQWMGEFAATRTLPTNVADLIRSVKKRLGVR